MYPPLSGLKGDITPSVFFWTPAAAVEPNEVRLLVSGQVKGGLREKLPSVASSGLYLVVVRLSLSWVASQNSKFSSAHWILIRDNERGRKSVVRLQHLITSSVHFYGKDLRKGWERDKPMAQCFSLTLPDVNMSIRGSLEPGQTKKAQSLGIHFPGVKVRCRWMDMHTPYASPSSFLTIQQSSHNVPSQSYACSMW